MNFQSQPYCDSIILSIHQLRTQVACVRELLTQEWGGIPDSSFLSISTLDPQGVTLQFQDLPPLTLPFNPIMQLCSFGTFHPPQFYDSEAHSQHTLLCHELKRDEDRQNSLLLNPNDPEYPTLWHTLSKGLLENWTQHLIVHLAFDLEQTLGTPLDISKILQQGTLFDQLTYLGTARTRSSTHETTLQSSHFSTPSAQELLALKIKQRQSKIEPHSAPKLRISDLI